MNRLLSAGFYRLFRNRLFVGILLFMAAMAVIIPAVIHSEMVKYQLEGSIETVLGIHTAFTRIFYGSSLRGYSGYGVFGRNDPQ